jgi:hypothetical protein
MLTRMQAEICFCNYTDQQAAVTELIEQGFGIRELDWIDTASSACWIIASSWTELDASEFLDRVNVIVGDNGFVVEAGLELTHEQTERTQ